jgi:hypothetical protein
MNTQQFYHTLVNGFFNVKLINPKTKSDSYRVSKYRIMVDEATGLFAWDGKTLQYIKPYDAYPEDIIEKYPNCKFYFVKPNYSSKNSKL